MAAYGGGGVVDFERSVRREKRRDRIGILAAPSSGVASGKVPKLHWSEEH